MNNTQIYQKMKSKGCLSIEKILQNKKKWLTINNKRLLLLKKFDT